MAYFTSSIERMLMMTLVSILSMSQVAFAAFDPCMPHGSCNSCIKDTNNSCGWCSQNVHYKDGLDGGHCASSDGTHEFSCPGVFSKLQCQPGWMCNTTSEQCVADKPGQGQNYTECLHKCGAPNPNPPAVPTGPAAPVYQCNHKTRSCEKSNEGNGTSRAVCEVQCKPPPPVAPVPPVPPQNTYSCNKTTFQCKVDPDGGSRFLCESTCTPPPQQYYTCNQKTQQCEKAPKGTDWYSCELECKNLFSCDEKLQQCVPDHVNGIPKAICDEFCSNGNASTGIIGNWRGLSVGTSTVLGEWDFSFKNDSLTVAWTTGSASGKATGGIVFGVSGEHHAFTWTAVSSNIPKLPIGKYNMIFAFDAAQPESRFVIVASGMSGATYPAAFPEAFANSNEFIWGMSTCQSETHCRYRNVDTRDMLAKRGIFVTLGADDEETTFIQEEEVAVVEPTVTDPCENYGSCTACRAANPKCGWCTGKIVYEGNIQGKQCAGGGYPNIRFKCVGGNYHADDCSDYVCIEPQAICKQVSLGNGQPKAICNATCKPAPSPPSMPPSPPSAIYLCNHTSHQCKMVPPHTDGGASFLVCQASCKPAAPSTPTPSGPQDVYACNTTIKKCQRVAPGTPGSTSKLICEHTCAPKPPSPVLLGKFRGIQTDNLYVAGEYDLNIYSNNSYVQTFDGVAVDNGRVWEADARGHLVFVSDFSGTIRPAIFSSTEGKLFAYLTFVFGSSQADVPTGWDTPWIFGGEKGREYVYYKMH